MARSQRSGGGKSFTESRMVQDNIKAIYAAGEWGEEKFSVSQLAQQMQVAVSTASENVRRLTELGLVAHEPYRGVTLTKTGMTLALKMVRKHRLLETYLHQRLGFNWDEVHEEAEILEHAASERLIEHIDADLGFPTADPHGDPIPRKDGTLVTISSQALAEVESGQEVAVVRIDDDNPHLLRFFEKSGIVPGATLQVLDYHPVAGVMTVAVAGREISLGQPAVESIWVSGS